MQKVYSVINLHDIDIVFIWKFLNIINALTFIYQMNNCLL